VQEATATKRCPCCGETKPHDAFALSAHKADGRMGRCKACDNARSKAYYHATKQQGPKRCTKCGETKAASEFPPHKKTLDRRSSWCRPCHREAVRRSNAKPDSAVARRLAENAKQRAERTAARADLERYEHSLRRDPCSYCGEIGGEADHIQASVKGGPDHWTNRAGVCRSCNAAKKDRDLLQFLLMRPLWSQRSVIDEQLRRLAA
jgi:hypothetical protein